MTSLGSVAICTELLTDKVGSAQQQVTEVHTAAIHLNGVDLSTLIGDLTDRLDALENPGSGGG